MRRVPGFTAEVALGIRSPRPFTEWSRVQSQPEGAFRILSAEIPSTPAGVVGKPSTGVTVPGLVTEFGECRTPGCDICGGNLLEGKGIPVYGNWCGPGHGSGPPIDPVDAACKAHDECYSERGYLDCSCDRELVDNMPTAIADPRTPLAGKTCGAAVATWFSISPCVCRTEVCFPVPVLCTETFSYPCWCWRSSKNV